MQNVTEFAKFWMSKSIKMRYELSVNIKPQKYYFKGDHVILQLRCTRSLRSADFVKYFVILSVHFEPLCIGSIMSTSTVKGDRKERLGNRQ